VRDDSGLHWTSAETSLGKSCIAWTDNDETSPRACLAISDCGVQFSRADDPELSLAKQAVTKLCDALEVIVSNPKLAEELEWSATGHDLMEIEDVLRSWTQCLSSAAEAAKARGMSTAEAWEWIRDHGSGRMAG
jgi:hypothetical protein